MSYLLLGLVFYSLEFLCPGRSEAGYKYNENAYIPFFTHATCYDEALQSLDLLFIWISLTDLIPDSGV